MKACPREERERYARAFYYAIAEKDLQFATGDAFADWFARVGWLLHNDHVEVGFFYWSAGPKPRPEGDDE